MRIPLALFALILGIVATAPAWAQTVGLTPDERTHLKAKGLVTMCVDPAWMPYESIDERGKHIGIAADFVKLFSNMLEVPIELVPTQTWNESLIKAQKRDCDIVSLLNKTNERAQYLSFTEPYIDAAVVLVARDDVVYLDGFNALKGRTLGVVEGYVYESHIRSNYPDVRLVYVDNLDDALNRVSRGEIFAAVDSLFIVTHHMQDLGLSNLKIAGQTDFTHALRVGVRNDDPLLLRALQKAVQSVSPVERNEILQRWFTVRFEHGTDYATLWKVLGGVALLMAFLGYRYSVQSRFNVQLKAKNAELLHLSQTDTLTGVYNRLKTDSMLDQEYERSQRYDRALSVVMFDLDYFKKINDTYGHQAGDRVLINCSALVLESIRKHDILGRWGGEEFLILCPETDIDGAERLAQNLRERLERMDMGEVGTVTASFGVAQLGKADDVKRLIGHADKALYQAKQDGRNHVRSYHPTV